MTRPRKTKSEKQPVAPSTFDLTLNVLGYVEDDEWVALALEMDLRGYGATFKEACEDLAEVVAMQIGFAVFKGQPEMILKPAEPVWFERFAEVRHDRLDAFLHSRRAADSNYSVGVIPIPPAHVIESLKSSFSET